MRIRLELAAVCAVVTLASLSACGNESEPDASPQAQASASPLATRVSGPEANDIEAWKFLARDPERVEQFVHTYLGLMQTHTPGLTEEERDLRAVAVTESTLCNVWTLEDGAEVRTFVGLQPTLEDNGPSVMADAIGYCAKPQPRTILYSVEGMRRQLAASWTGNIQRLTFGFAAYLSDPQGRGADFSRDRVDEVVRGCVEGRIMHGLLKAGFIRDKFDLFSSPWEIKDGRLAAFDKAVQTGTC